MPRADRALEDSDSPWRDALASLAALAGALRRRREEAGAVEIDQPEMVIRVRESGVVEVTVGSRSAPARSMVAEMMVLCNSLLARYCADEGLPAAYRSQPAPESAPDPDPALPEAARRYLVMRRFRRAEVSIVPRAHDGLGVPAYLQATSPIRRYPDLFLQRQIAHYLTEGAPVHSTEEVASVAQRAEAQLPELARIEGQRRRYWFLKFLKQRLERGSDSADALFDAVVLQAQERRPALLELVDYPFRFRSEIPASSSLGDTVTLRLHGVDLWRRTAQFVPRPVGGGLLPRKGTLSARSATMQGAHARRCATPTPRIPFAPATHPSQGGSRTAPTSWLPFEAKRQLDGADGSLSTKGDLVGTLGDHAGAQARRCAAPTPRIPSPRRPTPPRAVRGACSISPLSLRERARVRGKT